MQSIFNASRALKARGLATLPALAMMALGALAWPSVALAWTGQPLAYVANFGAATVSVIDTGDNAVVATVGVGVDPYGVAITPDGTRVYVTNSFNNNVSVIDATVNPPAVVATVAVGDYPYGVAITPDGKRAYVANALGSTVSVIDATANPPAVVATVAVQGGSYGVAITPDGTRAYVTNSLGSTVSVIDATANPPAVVATVAVGNSPQGVAITPDGKRAYVTNGGSTTVSVIDATANPPAVVATVAVGDGPNSVAITPDGTRAYVTNYHSQFGTVSVIDATANPPAVVATVTVVDQPIGVAITPDRTRAYVTSYSEGTVSVIDATANPPAVVATVAVGNNPIGVAIISAPQGTSFLAFKAKLDINLGQKFFALRSEFTLSSTASPVDPATQPVKLQVGPFITTIPAGSFTQTERGSYAYQGAIDGVQLDVKIAPTGTLRYKLHATAKGANMTGATNPAQVSYSIGGNAGLTNVNANFDQSNQAAQN